MNIKSTVTVKANGFVPTLEFPNGGRQLARSVYRSMTDAQEIADQMKRLRIEQPDGCVRDPMENECQTL
jgi:hypothetical protein